MSRKTHHVGKALIRQTALTYLREAGNALMRQNGKTATR
jgi:hypothetical protein